jgi:galactonate dehydratase
LKIAQVETFLVSRYLIVRITTEDGTQGIGESSYWAFPRAAEETVKVFAGDIIGMDARDNEHIWNYLHRKYSFRGNSIAGAISAIDIALWDIKGKRLQAPVWDLLGGRARQKVRAIALGVGGATPDEAAASARKAKDDGYSALKFTPLPGEWWLEQFPDLIRGTAAILEAVREAVGWDFDIGVEIHRNMLPSDAIVFVQHAAKYLPYFIEDPIAPDSVVAMAEVSEKMNLPLAVGERNTGIWEFMEYAQLAKCHFFKPDVGLAGGITHTKKIAAVGEAHHIRIAPHNFLGPVVTAACIHLGIATPNWDVLEAARDEAEGARGAIIKEPNKIVDGYFIPSEKPGLGVEFNEEEAAKYPFEQWPSNVPIRDDGSVALR